MQHLMENVAAFIRNMLKLDRNIVFFNLSKLYLQSETQIKYNLYGRMVGVIKNFHNAFQHVHLVIIFGCYNILFQWIAFFLTSVSMYHFLKQKKKEEISSTADKNHNRFILLFCTTLFHHFSFYTLTTYKISILQDQIWLAV